MRAEDDLFEYDEQVASSAFHGQLNPTFDRILVTRLRDFFASPDSLKAYMDAHCSNLTVANWSPAFSIINFTYPEYSELQSDGLVPICANQGYLAYAVTCALPLAFADVDCVL